MQLRIVLPLLLSVVAVSCFDGHGLKIIAVNKDGMLEEKSQKGLASALKWFESAISVEKAPADKIDNLMKPGQQLEEYKDVKKVTVQTPNKLFSAHLQSAEFNELRDEADFTIFIKKGDCESDREKRAYAGPISYGTNRPTIIVLYYCYGRFKEEFNYFNLFRHEILHGLGYGTVETSSDGVKTESYQWKFEDGTEQTATRYFRNFGDAATEAVRKHFNCYGEQLNGVETDASGKHLNQYIFQNELMTPVLHMDDFFSYISAEIVERITAGSEPWYKVNREFIAPEAESYEHAIGFGCTFLLRSCHEYLDEIKSQGLQRPLVMCPEDESIKQCWVVDNTLRPYSCTAFVRRSWFGKPADNGVVRTEGQSKYMIPYTRYCPIYHQIYEFPKNVTLKPCDFRS